MAGGGGKIQITRPESAFGYLEVKVSIPFLLPRGENGGTISIIHSAAADIRPRCPSDMTIKINNGTTK
jgi:hypothetical protein